MVGGFPYVQACMIGESLELGGDQSTKPQLFGILIGAEYVGVVV